MSDPATTDSGLVPLVDRIRGLLACRPLLAGGALAAFFLGGTTQHGSTVLLLAVTCAYLALSSLMLLAPRMSRSRAIRLNSLGLLLDGVYLAVAAYGYQGFSSPVSALLLVHLVAVTLLASFRSGLKVALWNTLLLAVLHELQKDGVAPALVPSPDRTVVLAIGGLWMVTLTTAAFASANERELRRRNFDSAALARLALRLEASLEPYQVASTLLTAVTEDHQIARALVLGATPDGLERLAGKGDVDLRRDEDDEGAEAPAGGAGPVHPGEDHMVTTAVSQHRSVRVARLDPTQDPWLSAALPKARNLLIIPLFADGSVVAVLVTEHGSRRGGRVERRVLEMVERYASHAALALTNARLLGQVRRLADTDGLTGVANRRTFDHTLAHELARAVSTGEPVSLVMVDIDHFKKLNDVHGHQVGDLALQRVAHALQGAVRRSDTLARYGGEEFAVIAPGASPERAVEVAERLRAAVAVASDDPPVTASFGVATTLDPTLAPRDLLSAADQALYRSKEAGRNRVTGVALPGDRPVPVGDEQTLVGGSSR